MDATVFQKEGVFDKGPAALWSCSWRRGQEVLASIGYRLEAITGSRWALRFNYTSLEPTGEKTNHEYSVPLDCTPCHFGGVRWWFICSLVVEGAHCGRRVRKLYLPPGARYFGCRTCHNLTYKSAQEHDKRVHGFLRLPPSELVKALKSRQSGKFLLALKACSRLLG